MNKTIEDHSEEIEKMILDLYTARGKDNSYEMFIKKCLTDLETITKDYKLADSEYFVLYIATIFHESSFGSMLSIDKFKKTKQRYNLTKHLSPTIVNNIIEVMKQQSSLVEDHNRSKLGKLMFMVSKGYPLDQFEYLDFTISNTLDRYDKSPLVDEAVKDVEAIIKEHVDSLTKNSNDSIISKRELDVLESMTTNNFKAYTHNRVKAMHYSKFHAK